MAKEAASWKFWEPFQKWIPQTNFVLSEAIPPFASPKYSSNQFLWMNLCSRIYCEVKSFSFSTPCIIVSQSCIPPRMSFFPQAKKPQIFLPEKEGTLAFCFPLLHVFQFYNILFVMCTQTHMQYSKSGHTTDFYTCIIIWSELFSILILMILSMKFLFSVATLCVDILTELIAMIPKSLSRFIISSLDLISIYLRFEFFPTMCITLYLWVLTAFGFPFTSWYWLSLSIWKCSILETSGDADF